MRRGLRRGRVLGPAAAVVVALLWASTAFASPTPVAITGGPDGLTNDATPTFTWDVQPDTTVACRVDAEPFGTCSGPEASHTTSELPDGPHTFEIRAGGTEETYGFAQRSFTVDTVAPVVSLTATPPSPTTDPTPTWDYSADDEDAVFFCVVFGDTEWSECGEGPAGEYTTHPVGDGDHGFIVTAFDPAGNRSPFVGDEFTVDTMFPVTRIRGARRTRDRTPTFTLAADPGSTFRCSVNDRAWFTCTSPITLGPFRRGIHDFEALATDPAGNEQPVSSYARLRIIPLPCRAFAKPRRRLACRCSKLRNRVRRKLCYCNRFHSKANRRKCRARVSAAASSATAPRAASSRAR